MPNHRALTADERLADLHRGRERLRKERMVREIAGPVWGRMMGIVPALFRLQGRLVTRVLRAPREDVIHALGQDAVFAVDTAMRLMHGAGSLRGRRACLCDEPGAHRPADGSWVGGRDTVSGNSLVARLRRE